MHHLELIKSHLEVNIWLGYLTSQNPLSLQKFCLDFIKKEKLVSNSLALTRTPGIAKQDESSRGTSLLVVLGERRHLKSVAAHWGGGRGGDVYGGALEVQALWFNVGSPVSGRSMLNESDGHCHIQAAWGEKTERDNQPKGIFKRHPCSTNLDLI